MKMQIVCKSLFTKSVQNVQHLQFCMDTCLETLYPLVNSSVSNDFAYGRHNAKAVAVPPPRSRFRCLGSP